MTTAAQRRAAHEASRPLSEEMALRPGDRFTLRSRSRGGHAYPMVVTPDGYVIHDGEDCESTHFNGLLSCWHSKESMRYVMTTTRDVALRSEGILTPAPISFSKEQMQVITDTICKGATPVELNYFTSVCTRTGLDPFMGQIYAVKRWSSDEKRQVMAIQIGVDGRRLVAERTGKYAGQDPIEWLDEDGVWSMVWTAKGEFPVAARCSVYRKDWPDHKATAVCRWDSFAQYLGNPAKLSPTWTKMPDHMLGKCAENLALKKAFSAEMSFVESLTGGYDASADADVYIEPKEGFIEGELVKRSSIAKPETPTRVSSEAPGEEKPTGNPPQEHAGVPTSPAQEDVPIAPTADQLKNISRLITEVKQSWGATSKDFIEMAKELRGKYGDEKLKDYSLLSYDEATELLLYLRRKNGEPVDMPLEDEIPATAQG